MEAVSVPRMECTSGPPGIQAPRPRTALPHRRCLTGEVQKVVHYLHESEKFMVSFGPKDTAFGLASSFQKNH